MLSCFHHHLCRCCLFFATAAAFTSAKTAATTIIASAARKALAPPAARVLAGSAVVGGVASRRAFVPSLTSSSASAAVDGFVSSSPRPPFFKAAAMDTGGGAFATGGRRGPASTLRASGASSSAHPDGSTPLPLIDVDCNLLHLDLMSVLDGKYANDSRDDDKSPPPEFRILHHPSTVKSHVVGMVSPSSTVEESERSVRLLRSAAAAELLTSSGVAVRLRTTAGVHPYHVLEEGEPGGDALGRLREILEGDRLAPASERVVSCVGETGLDYSDGFPPKEPQRAWFRAQLALAREYGLPVFLHERGAFEDCVRCLDEAGPRSGDDGDHPKVIVHCFTGTAEECRAYAERGYYFSVSGYILKSGDGPDAVRACLRDGTLPLDRLMIETDAPYMGFPNCRETFFAEEEERAGGNDGDGYVGGKDGMTDVARADRKPLLSGLNSKQRKRLLKGQYPNVPSALPSVLRKAWELVNEGRKERAEKGEDGANLSLEEFARITTINAVEFFGMDDVVGGPWYDQ